MLSCEFSETFQQGYFTDDLPTTASFNLISMFIQNPLILKIQICQVFFAHWVAGLHSALLLRENVDPIFFAHTHQALN